MKVLEDNKMINNILKEKYKDEKVYVVPYNEILYIGDKFTPVKYNPIDFKIFDNIGTFMYRYEVEIDWHDGSDKQCKGTVGYII